MKKHIVWGWLLLPIIACAQMQISTVEHVSQEVTPDVLRGMLHFSEEGKQQDAIKEHLNAIVLEIKQFDPKNEWCRGGGYRLTPRYAYQDGKQIFLGYSGTLSFTCEFASIAPYNMVNARIERIKDKNVRTTQGALEWIVSEQARNTASLELRSSLLQTANRQAKLFSQETQQQCVISSVAFEGTQPMRPVLMRANAASMKASVAVEEPLQSNETVTLQAVIHYACSPTQP
jgi:hypothetical protein